MSAPVRGMARPWALGAVLAAAVLVPVFVRQELRSVERANRLYRSGDAVAAAEIYGRVLDTDAVSPTTFNLGTALLPLDADSANVLLAQVTEVPDRTTAQRGYYNLGFGQLVASGTASTPDSVLPTLRAAVRSFRAALRLDPHDQDARWNLALAIRTLEALLPPGEETGEESGSESDDEVPMNDAQMARSEDAPAESGPEPPDPRPASSPLPPAACRSTSSASG